MVKYFILGFLWVCFPIYVLGQTKSNQFKQSIRFDVTSDSLTYKRALSKSLTLIVAKVPYVGIKNFGWEVEVIKRNNKPYHENLLYHSSQWHGPYPTQIFSNHDKSLFPEERVLTVQGYPYEIRIRLIDCLVEGSGENGFKSGQIEVSWHRKQ